MVILALAGVTAICWLYLIEMARGMEGMSMTAAGIHPWTAHHFAVMLAMWVIMMVGMMLPSAAPTTLVYAAVARKARREGGSVAPVAVFVFGYGVSWAVFSLAATAAQWALDEASLLSPMLVAASPALGAALLVAAGVYQLTPWKDACLEHCRSPAHFIAAHWRPGVAGALRLGVLHGAYCVGCCWALMGLLFFGGVMNLLWIGAITLFVLIEKILPIGRSAGRLAAWCMIGSGVVLFARGVG